MRLLTKGLIYICIYFISVLARNDALVPLTFVLSLFLFEIWGRESALWISIEGSSEKEDEWFWFVNLVMNPSARLGDSKASPLVL